MSLISAKLTDKIYFSYEEKIQNNFSFEITYSVDDSQIYNNLIKSISENDTLSIYIEGLQKLFKKKDELNNFAEALNAKNQETGWNVSDNDDGLVIKHSADILKNDFSVLFNTHYVFTNDFKDNESILVKVYFDLPASTEDPIHQNFSIKVYEAPYIDSLAAINSKGHETPLIIKGHTASIQWETNTSFPNQGSAILYDETRTTPLEKNIVTIDKDRKFTLVVTKHEKEISRDISIKAVYIENIEALDSNDKSINEVIKGETVKIIWSLSNSDETTKVYLLDETKEAIDPNKIIIDRDRTFTLKVDQGGDTITKEISIKAVFIEKIDIQDSDGNKVKSIYKGEKAKINWSLINGENAKVSLLDENEHEVSNEIIIDRDRTLTLKVELNGKFATETITVFKTLWKKEKVNLSIPFKPDKKSNPKIIQLSNMEFRSGYYTYIHPTLYYSNNLTEWNTTPVTVNIPDSFKYYTFDITFVLAFVNLDIYFTDVDKITEFEYNMVDFSCQHGWDIPKPFPEIEESQFCFFKYMIKSYPPYDYHDAYFCVLENSILVYKGIWRQESSRLDFPKDVKIISIDFINFFNDGYNAKNFLAILCNDNHIYVYEITLEESIFGGSHEFRWNCISIFDLEKNDQKKVTLVKANSIYVVTDNYVFELNGNKDLSETHFSPLETTKENQGTMIIGPKDNNSFAAIVQDGDNASLWTYG